MSFYMNVIPKNIYWTVGELEISIDGNTALLRNSVEIEVKIPFNDLDKICNILKDIEKILSEHERPIGSDEEEREYFAI